MDYSELYFRVFEKVLGVLEITLIPYEVSNVFIQKLISLYFISFFQMAINKFNLKD